LQPVAQNIRYQLSAPGYRLLLVPVHNSSAVQVVWTQLNGYAVTRQNTDEVLAHSSRNVG